MGVPWPPGVNQRVLRTPIDHEIEEGAYRFKPDVGPAINHSRSIVAGEKGISFRQWFPDMEYGTLVNWRRDDLANATLAFDRLHPFDDTVTATFTFAPGGFKLVDTVPGHKCVAFILDAA